MDVGTKNFEDALPNILLDIKNASFISIDTEFTGLLTDDSFKRSYFDNASALYKKELKNLEDVSICQIGISTFKGIKECNSYSVSTYNVYIRPHSILSVDDNILWQVSSLEFLKECQFNFTKWIEEGVPCLRHDQETEVRDLYSKFLSGDLGNYFMPREVTKVADNIKTWLEGGNMGDTTEVQFVNNSFVLFFYISILSLNLHVNVSYLGNSKVLITNVESVDEVLIKSEALRALDMMVDQLRGFVKVFSALVEAKVPVIFHNGMLDILLIYKQFYENLPESFNRFCEKVHELFPHVYDTKQLAFKLGIKLKENQQNENGIKENQNENEEGKVYEKYFSNTSLKMVQEDTEKIKAVLYKPTVQHSLLTPKYSNGCAYAHEAGYDAFITGFCFLQLSHIYAMSQYAIKYHRPLSPRELTHSMLQWKNEIPIQRAGVSFLALDKRTVNKIKRSSWLVMESRNPFRALRPEIVASSLKSFGALDIVRRNKRSVMIATPKYSVAKDILRVYSDDKTFSVSKYTPIRHSVFIRSLVWSCALFSTGVSTWCIMKTIKTMC